LFADFDEAAELTADGADEAGDGDGSAELGDDVDEAVTGPPPPCTRNGCAGVVGNTSGVIP
jgi:hypothetical protein